MKKFIVLFLVSFVFVGCGDDSEYNSNSSYLDDSYNSFIESEITTNEIEEINPEIKEIVDSKKFALVSSEKLIGLMGQPKDVEEWNFTTSKGTFPAKTYSYDTEYHYEFLVIDNKVVRMNCYSLKYWNGNGESIKYTSKNDIPRIFGVTEEMGVPSDTGYAIRWSNLTGSIKDFWVINVDDTAKTIDGVKVTYDELYLD